MVVISSLLVDTLKDSKGQSFTLQAPAGIDLPKKGFIPGDNYFQSSLSEEASSKVAIKIKEGSQKMALFEAFPKWDGKDLVGMKVLVKCEGKCTTDHISAAGE